MQGRLSIAPPGESLDWFPAETWKDEFYIAEEIGFKYMELIVDRYSSRKNPLLNPGIYSDIIYLSKKHNINLPNCCLNNIIENSIFTDPGLKGCLELIDILVSMNIKNIILPLFGASEFNLSNLSQTKILISKITNYIKNKNVNLLFESDVPASLQKILLDDISSTNVGLVYDLGNASFSGYDLLKDLIILKDHIKLIHIKDKNNKGVNVSLGKGIVDFSKFKDGIYLLNPNLNFTLETARGKNPLEEQKSNFNFIREIIN